MSMAGSAPGATHRTLRADVRADNWFALYVGAELIKEDSVAYYTERSFNSESFSFEADLPAQINVIIKDFKENDTGLEYIGSPRQQIGDGGFIARGYSDARMRSAADVSAYSTRRTRTCAARAPRPCH